MEVIEYMYAHPLSTICFLLTIGIVITAILIGIRGKSIW